MSCAHGDCHINERSPWKYRNAGGESLAFSDDFNDGKEDGATEAAFEGLVLSVFSLEWI
jgi:hypothetical protein